MKVGLLDEKGMAVVSEALPGSILFQITPQDRALAVGIVYGLIEKAEEEGDGEAIEGFTAVLAEIESGFSPSVGSPESMFDMDVRVLSMGGNLVLRGADARTVIFLFDPIEERELAVNILESMLSADGLFCGPQIEKLRRFIESIESEFPTSIN